MRKSLRKQVARYKRKERAMFSGANVVAALTSSSEATTTKTKLRERVVAKKGMRAESIIRDEPSLLSETGEDNDQPVSEVCRRGTCVAKWTAIMLLLVFLSGMLMNYSEKLKM